MPCPDAPLRRRRLLLAAMTLQLVGCLPMPYGRYHLPSAVDAPARRRRGWCQGQAGPETQIELDTPLPWVAQVLSVPGRADLLRVELTLPASRGLQFASDELQLVGADGRVLAQRPQARVRRAVRVTPRLDVDAAKLSPAATAQPSIVAAVLTADGPAGYAPTSLKLAGPRLLADGRSVAVPTIELDRPDGDAVLRYHSLERRRALEAQVGACRRDTPQRACDNLLRYDDLSFEQADGSGFAWRGTVSSFDSRVRPRPLRIELTLDAPHAGRWRLDDPTVMLSDAATGHRESVRVESMTLRFDQTVALSAPIRPAPAEHPAETRWQVEVPLPADLDRFELRLPAARLDGREATFPRLRFESRAFDGGFEPFNC